MSQSLPKRSRLLVGCGSAALALGLVLGPDPAAAQGIQASGNVVLGSAEIVPGSNSTTVDIFTPTVVIDWSPLEDGNGNALTFLPNGSLASFQTSQLPDFAVLNRILPSTNGNVAVIDGAVISRVQNVSGQLVPGGFVAFYSPTGILIGSTATFDVGRLLLTTLDTNPAAFQGFVEQGIPLTLFGAPGSTAKVQISAGAQIQATPENAFFAVVAADVEMRGTARINGSHAYVAGEVVNLNFSNGLFDISVPVGTAAGGEVVTLDGTVGGPSSTGNTGDNHMIYAVARAAADPISMLLRGNLGFDPAQSAGIVNGEIIVSANHDVFGRFVAGGSISDGVNASFPEPLDSNAVRADINIEDFTISSSLLAVGTHRTRAAAVNLASSIDGNLLLVGGELAELVSSNGRLLTVSGDVLASAQAFAADIEDPDAPVSVPITAQGGIARIEASGGTINIGGHARVLADAFGGVNFVNLTAGAAIGGQALLGASGAGTLNIGNSALLSAQGIGTNFQGVQVGASARGGVAELFARSGGNVLITGNALIDARSSAAAGAPSGGSTASDAFGGLASIRVSNGGGTIRVTGSAQAFAGAFAQLSDNAGDGSLADAGEAVATIDGPGTITVDGDLRLSATATGGTNLGGTGGKALGGRASAFTASGGAINVGLRFEADASAIAGSGRTGGDAFGGIAGAVANIGTIAIGGSAFVTTDADGGHAFDGTGGNGGLGRGGNSALQATGTLTQTARLTVGQDAFVSARGYGGLGGAANIETGTPAGRGGDGFGGQFTIANQADPAFNSGAFILAGGDNGTIEITGPAVATASGFGGIGGTGSGTLAGGAGGNGFGGLAQVGLALLGQNGSLGNGIARFGDLFAGADGEGGHAGLASSGSPASLTGAGGNGTGGDAFLTVRAGDVTAATVGLAANGSGGGGRAGGIGAGGQAAVFGSLGGTLTASGLGMEAKGFGGSNGFEGAGGNGIGGRAAIEGDAITATINGDLIADSSGVGGFAQNGAPGSGTGGEAYIATLTANNGGAITVTGLARVAANGSGGTSFGGFAGGNGTGGLAYVDALGGGNITLAKAQVNALGFGQIAQSHKGGDGTGGTGRLRASGTGSRLTIQDVAAANSPVIDVAGVGAATVGGDGIGGVGRGGTLQLIAAQGGTLTMPASAQSFLTLGGFGGTSSVEGGTGGAGIGGTATVLADGGTLVAGQSLLFALSEGGASANADRNITGGNATGATVSVRVINNGTLSMDRGSFGALAVGGTGSGSGNGGNATAQSVLLEILDSTVNLTGSIGLFNQAGGGTGLRGGNAVGGTVTFNGVNARLNLAPDAAANAVLSVSNLSTGGNGVDAGGNAQVGQTLVTLSGTQASGGALSVGVSGFGGNASAASGSGGNVTGGSLSASITNSTMNLAGSVGLGAFATGGTGGTAGTGGSATSAAVDVDLVGSALAIVAGGPSNLSSLDVRTQATGGQGLTVGNATTPRASLTLANSTISATNITVASTAVATTSGTGQTGGTAVTQEARLLMSGTSGVTANFLGINANAFSAQGGIARAGLALLQANSGSTATVTAPQVDLRAEATSTADAVGGIAASTEGGRAIVTADGGNLAINGSVVALARGLGPISGDITTGATARGGLAQLFARLGGTVSVSGNLTLDASAIGAIGSLTNPSSVSNAFGGDAVVNIGTSGGSITVGGNALVVARAQGGNSNNAGAGSLADAGQAVVNVNTTGQINITGSLRLDAAASGGTNAGGVGGTALGGRASATTFAGGTIRTGAFTADTTATGGNGRTGGDAFGGIGGANAILGEIAITGNALSLSRGTGGNATFGVGGNGGTGRGGNAFFQADGNLTQTARLSITGDAGVFAEGFGGNGGIGDAVTAGGRGGDGFGGGQGNVPNQADPAFGSGAFLLAGGDNGTLVIGGQATANAFAGGGRGGDGGTGTAAGRGGDASAGLAQAGLALLGGTGAVGAGSAQFAQLSVQSNAAGGAGGTASLATLLGTGGNGLGGTAALTVRAGDVTATSVNISATGSGGSGGTGGNGTGGFAGVFGSLAGGLSLGQLQVFANGNGGASTGTGNGGIGRGGDASINFSLIDTSISGDVLIDANGFGGGAATANGGAGFGGNARVGTLGTAAGNGNIAGNTRVLANGVGGAAQTAASGVGGNGTGGLAEALALNGGVSRFGSLQVGAGGQGGAATSGTYVGGNGTGGTANLRASGTGSQLIVLRNTPTTVGFNLNSGSIAAAIGFGGDTTGGSGVGGTGTGGSINITAQAGGLLALPATPFQDPNSIGFNRLYARGFGGASLAEGGVGGAATGGTATLLADGGTLSMGETVLSAFSQGGSSNDPARNVTGGAAFGGTRIIRVTNGGVANLHLVGGVSGGVGGNGSGTGNGGNATGGTNFIEVIGATLNAIGSVAVVDQSTGGNGQRGGDAVGNGPNGALRFTATDATINLAADANGVANILVGGFTSGGQGVVAGGNATGSGVTVSLTNTRINGGSLNMETVARGGAATAADGIGGTATAGLSRTTITGSTLALKGESAFRSDAIGGAGGATGRGGSASAAPAEAILTDSTVNVTAAGATLPGIFRVQSNATGGLGGTVGNATSSSATLSLVRSALNVDQIIVSATAFANGGTGQTGGAASSGDALVSVAGSSTANAPLIEIAANALTSAGGTARAGASSLQLASGSTGSVTAGQLRLLADASGAAAGSLANTTGQFSVIVGGGNVNAGSLTASSTGDRLAASPPSSELAAVGGNLNVSGALNATAFGDILLRTAQGGIIGNAATTNNATAVRVESAGTIQTLNDGTAGSGLAGNGIDLLAGRSILLGGNLIGRGGAVNLTANRGGGPALAQAPASVITMAQGTRIDAGTGTVTMRLLDGAGDPQRASGAITLASISAGKIDVRNLGTSAGSNIAVRADGVLTASGTGRAIDLASLNGEVTNLAGDAGLVLTGGGHYAIFAATPTGSQIGSFANYARRYNVATAAAYDALNPGGNFAAFRIAPVITVTADNASRIYGNANPAFTASFAGFLPGDGVGNLSGSALFTTSATAASGVGTYAINAALGSLLSDQGYQFTFSPGVLTVTARPITVTANNLSRFYGDANPVLGFTVGGLGLANGDQLTGALATTAGTTTGVGTAAITQGTLAANPNYALTFVDGVLSITARPITITANSFSRVYGNANPALTYSVGGAGLVNGDQITGALTTTAGVTTGVGNVAITRGTLAVNPNYLVTFVDGVLTITPRPITVTADNLTKVGGTQDPNFTFAVSGDGLVNGDQLSGGLTRDPGEAPGPFAIRQGTLGNPNYAITYVGGVLTITAPPTPPEITNPSSIAVTSAPAETASAEAAADAEADEDSSEEEEDSFGMDFPSRADVPLISEDTALDDPVTSGGDSSLYSGDVGPAPGNGEQ